MNTAAFYEARHGIGANYFTIEENRDFSFPLHMHRCYELVYMLEGEMTVRIEKESYRLRAGDMIFIKPNRVHSFEEPSDSRHILCVFSPELIAAVSEQFIQYKLTSPVYRDTETLYRDLFLGMNEKSNIATVKGFLYLLCGLFYPGIDFSAEDTYTKDTLLLRDILLFVENNTDRACTLESLAEELKYTASHLSRFFSAHVGISYNTYVRNVKMNRACHLLQNTKESVLNIAMKCGYTSISSFNRSFKQMMGINPTEYRRKPPN